VNATRLLVQTCTISRRTGNAQATNTTYGQVGSNFSNVATGVLCNVQRKGNALNEDEYGRKTTPRIEYQVYFLSTQDVRTGDHLITITNPTTGESMTDAILNVQGAAIDDVGRGAYLRVNAERVIGGGGL
jgi:hypothetical protein